MNREMVEAQVACPVTSAVSSASPRLDYRRGAPFSSPLRNGDDWQKSPRVDFVTLYRGLRAR